MWSRPREHPNCLKTEEKGKRCVGYSPCCYQYIIVGPLLEIQRSQSGKKAPLNARLLKQVARHVSFVCSMSVSIPIAPSPS
mmetsp:Transcript_24281/g.56602  ORF Transcript_24281/g.56602 Transcript_24281/m.56602 type:complete len:81 (+) Transcript_24281:361-603(+)